MAQGYYDPKRGIWVDDPDKPQGYYDPTRGMWVEGREPASAKPRAGSGQPFTPAKPTITEMAEDPRGLAGAEALYPLDPLTGRIDPRRLVAEALAARQPPLPKPPPATFGEQVGSGLKAAASGLTAGSYQPTIEPGTEGAAEIGAFAGGLAGNLGAFALG